MNALPAGRGWRARLELHFEASEGRTRIAHRRHEGPLVVQRAFYPEGASTGLPEPKDGVLGRRPAPASEPCHVYILHPPGGVASGDDLGVDVRVAPAAHALLTNPAAGKFYRRGAAGLARLAQTLHVADGGVLEWLPNENIYFPDASVAQGTRVDLDSGARFIGWELGCLGLPSQGQGLAAGGLGLGFELWRAGRPLLLERLRLDHDSLTARWGLGGCNAFGTWLGFPAAALDLERARASLPESCADMTVACTLVDGVLACRALGMRADHVKHAFVGLWRALRPSLAGRSAVPPRIWAT
jgi:urease accessory protein